MFHVEHSRARDGALPAIVSRGTSTVRPLRSLNFPADTLRTAGSGLECSGWNSLDQRGARPAIVPIVSRGTSDAEAGVSTAERLRGIIPCRGGRL